MEASTSVGKLDANDLLILLGNAETGDFAERRSEARHPFFSPVSLCLTDLRNQRLSAFSREVSYSGIGLLHNMPLSPGMAAELTISPAGAAIVKTAECVWCQPAGEGWYLSGWRFTLAR